MYIHTNTNIHTEMEAEIERLRSLIDKETGLIPTWREGAERLTGAADKLDKKVHIFTHICMHVCVLLLLLL